MLLSAESSSPEIRNLCALSRNTSVISTSSSDSVPSSTFPPLRPGRAFTAPRSQSPHSRTPRPFHPPSYLAEELGVPNHADGNMYNSRTSESRRFSKPRSKSRQRHGGVTVHDFTFGSLLGEGSYSTVKLGTHIRTGNQYAIKILEKAHLVKKDKLATALSEKNALVKLGAGHPGIVRLFYAFQDEWRLYFVIDLAKNGEMQSLIAKLGSLSIDCVRYYAAQVIDALEYMHSKGVIHRDLKPENLLLDENYRIKITDFGTGKVLDAGKDKADTWVGTAQYVSPELLEAKETSKSSDFWALGCIIYQMITGRFAFQGQSDFLTWQKIKQLDYTFPERFDSQAKDLVRRLLVRDPRQRLGAGSSGSEYDIQALRSHPFFSRITWETLWTDSHPPIEAGLVKEENIDDGQLSWDDVDSVWDKLVDNKVLDDGIAWSAEGDGPRYDCCRGAITCVNSIVHNGVSAEVTPLTPIMMDSDIRQNETEPQYITGKVVETGNHTTLPVSRRGSLLKNKEMISRAYNMSDEDVTHFLQDGRGGRIPTASPVLGNGHENEIDLAVLLGLPEGEKIVFKSMVESKPLRRRASRLLPIPVPLSKTKARQLVLTNRRLLCLKHVPQNPGTISIKSEVVLRAYETLKERVHDKETRGVVTAIEKKGDMEFAVLTTSNTTYSYATNSSTLATLWVEKLNAALVNEFESSMGRT